MTRLLVRLLPPDNPVDPESEAIDLFPPAPLRQFTIPCSKDETFSELWPRLEERIKSLYGSDLYVFPYKRREMVMAGAYLSPRPEIVDLYGPEFKFAPGEAEIYPCVFDEV